jgi:hypothetical protein
MQNPSKAIGAGVLALVGLVMLAGMLSRACGRSQRYVMANASVDVAVANKLAQEVSDRFEPGKVVVIRHTGFIPETVELQEAVVATCRRALDGDWTLVELPPEDFGEAEHGGWALRTGSGSWGGEIKAWMTPHQDAVAIISLVGIPHLSAEDWKKLPPFFGGIPFSTEYSEAALRDGMIEGLAVMREDADALAIRKFRGSAEDLFDLAYEWLTPEAP